MREQALPHPVDSEYTPWGNSMTGEHPPTAVPDRLNDAPLSWKYTYFALAVDEPATMEQLRRQTRIPERTLTRALGALEDRGEIRAETYMGDARKNWYERTREGDT